VKERKPEQVKLLKEHPTVNQLSAGSLYLYDTTYKTKHADELKAIAEEAVAVGAQALWLQPGCISDEAGAIARGAGLAFVQDVCTRQVHRDQGVGPIGPPIS
jgi:predicted xylose isomerase-like sugar epimerase